MLQVIYSLCNSLNGATYRLVPLVTGKLNNVYMKITSCIHQSCFKPHYNMVKKEIRKFQILWITCNLNEGLPIGSRCIKLESAYYMCKNFHNSKSLLLYLKLCHFISVVRQSILHASQCLHTNRKGPPKKIRD